MPTSVWTPLLDLLAPRFCPGCGERLLPDELVCTSCLLHLPYVRFSGTFLDNPLARLFWGLIPIEKAAALFYYEPLTLTARLVHAFKYNRRSDLAEFLGRQLAYKLSAKGFFEDIDALVPVPLTSDRLRERGYNQSHHIALGIGTVTGIPVYPNILERTQFQVSQTHQNLYERRENVRNAFRLADDRSLSGRHVLLVDDVITTGSTLLACATELLKTPGVRVSIATLGWAND